MFQDEEIHEVIRNLVEVHGLPVFPVNPVDKRPYTANGFYNATTDLNQIEEWSRSFPGCGWAVPTGSTTGIVVVDKDVKKGHRGIEVWQNLVDEHEPTPRTPAVNTPSGGHHEWYRMNGTVFKSKANALGDGVDTRAEGGYVVVPPTTGYEFAVSPDECAIADLPAWIANLMPKKDDEPRSTVWETGRVKLSKGSYSPDVEVVIDALLHLDSTRAENYDDWVKVGMALSTLGDEGLNLWKRWSSQSDKFDEREHDYKWSTFRPGEDDHDVGLGTIFYWAELDSDWTPNSGKPKVVINSRFDYIESLVKALADSNNPKELFVRNQSLATIVPNEDGRPGIYTMGTYKLKDEIARRIKLVKISEEEDGRLAEVPTAPPIDAVRAVKQQGHWPGIPSVDGVVTAPVFAPDGTLEDTPGYLPKSRLYFYPTANLAIGDTTPSKERVAWAKSLIMEHLLVNFPFESEASQANAVAELIQPFVRPMITGPTPIYAHDAPSPGSGKGLLAEALSTVFTGSRAEMLAPGENDAEWRKRITSALAPGQSHIIFDNVSGVVDSASLASVVTALHWTDRILGKSEQTSMPVRCTWVLTGNNIQTSIEIARRVVKIRLVPGVEHPSLRDRKEFKHTPLVDWVQANRSDLVTAVLVIVRNWIEAGQPRYTKLTIGSYESWSEVMGGILETAGISCFMDNYREQLLEGNSEARAWRALFEAWYEKFGSNTVTSSDIFPLASVEETKEPLGRVRTEGEDILGTLISGSTDRARKIQFGRLLGSKRDSVFGQYMLVDMGTKSRAQQYRLVKLS